MLSLSSCFSCSRIYTFCFLPGIPTSARVFTFCFETCPHIQPLGLIPFKVKQPHMGPGAHCEEPEEQRNWLTCDISVCVTFDQDVSMM